MPTTEVAVAILLLLIVPGFITRTVISSSITRRQRDAQEWIVEVAFFGAISALLFIIFYALTSWILGAPAPDIANLVSATMPLLAIAILYMVFCVLVPVLLGFAAVFLFQRGHWQTLHRWLGVSFHHPTPRAWDWYFSKGNQRGVVVTLVDGSKVAGFMDEGSFASSYPANEDLFIEYVFQLEGGKITGKLMPHTAGMWIQGSQIRLIEFYVPVALDEAENGEADHGE